MSFDPQPAIFVLQLRISLRGLSPPVWQRVLVPEHLTLTRLHNFIQAVMGWTDEHFHQFTFRGTRYGETHEGILQFSTEHRSDRGLAGIRNDAPQRINCD